MSRNRKTAVLFLGFLAITLRNFLGSCEALHVIHFRTITPEMKRMVTKANYPRNDPRKLEDLRERQKICDKVILAREYIIQNSHINETPTLIDKNPPAHPMYVNFQRVRSTSRDALPTDKEVAYYKNRGTWETKTMRLIECVRSRQRNWFVGFDQYEYRMYLVERLEWTTKVLFKFCALLEMKGTFSEIYEGPKMTQRLFQHYLEQARADPDHRKLQKATLCFLSLNEHGRVCGAVAETLYSFVRLTPSDIGHFNYVNIGQKRCNPKDILFSENEVVKANVLQCTVNRSREIPQFYVLGDRTTPGAVFVLKRYPGKQHQLKIITRIENIYVLMERDPRENIEKYKKKVLNML